MMTEWIQRPFVALALLAVGMAFIPLNDAFIKLMSGHLSLAQISVIRGIMSLAILAFVSTGFRSMFALSGAEFVQFFSRGMCLVVAMVLFFAALGSLPLPTCVAIFFVAPLLITLFSVPFLGERIGIHRSLSVLAGMAGVLLIIRPGTDSFQQETLLVLAAALSYALFQIWTRRLKSVGNLEAMVTVQHVAQALAHRLQLTTARLPLSVPAHPAARHVAVHQVAQRTRHARGAALTVVLAVDHVQPAAEGERRLPGAGFAHDAKDFALADGQRDVIDGGQHAAAGGKFDAQIADVQNDVAHASRLS